MNPSESISVIAQVIQLSVAPVFLLAGVGALLSMLTLRLARITDRVRLLEARIPSVDADQADDLVAEAHTHWRRIKLIYWAIRLAVASALLICIVVICLFLGEFIAIRLGTLIAALFVGSMSLISGALLCLLLEVSISTNRMRQRMEHQITQTR